MKTMIPLRIFAIAGNLTFIAYTLLGLYDGVFARVYPLFVLHAMLLPLNIVRLHQMKKLIKKVHDASEDDASIDYLIPYMTKEQHSKGEVLFRKGDNADRILFVQEGSLTLPEVEKELPTGTVLGEVGIFNPNHTRAASAVCSEDCIIYSIHRTIDDLRHHQE
jgi:hypothetical protein